MSVTAKTFPTAAPQQLSDLRSVGIVALDTETRTRGCRSSNRKGSRRAQRKKAKDQ